jgi:predicted glycosyltransferase
MTDTPNAPPAHAALKGTGEQRPRVLFYVQDSWGLGHIQRVAKLARALQDAAQCVLICGHREAGWVIPERCEYVRIPTLNVPLSKGANFFWGPQSPFDLSVESAIEMRRELIRSTIRAFDPDVFIVENRALGMSDELMGIIDQTKAARLFLTRGIMTDPRRVHRSFLSSAQKQAIREIFDAVIVAADQKVWDVAKEYDLSDDIAAKLHYVGYLSEPVDQADIDALRAERGVADVQTWVVCSAGGGALGERLVEEFKTVTAGLPNLVADVIHGPHSQLGWPTQLAEVIEERGIRVHKESRVLPRLHAAADLVVCPGGSSLLEVMEGGAPIITISVQPDKDDDQSLLSSRLARYHPITIIENYQDLGKALTAALSRPAVRTPARQAGLLDFDGLDKATKFIVDAAQRRRKGTEARLPR